MKYHLFRQGSHYPFTVSVGTFFKLVNTEKVFAFILWRQTGAVCKQNYHFNATFKTRFPFYE
jgi:hypothetical protein